MQCVCWQFSCSMILRCTSTAWGQGNPRAALRQLPATRQRRAPGLSASFKLSDKKTKEASSSGMLEKRSYFPVCYGCFFLCSCSVEVQIDARQEAVEKATQASSVTSSGFGYSYGILDAEVGG